MVSKKQNFDEILDVQKQYAFLGHDKPQNFTDFKKSVLRKLKIIENSMGKKLAKTIGAALILLMTFGYGCQKYDEPLTVPPQKQEMVTQSFSLEPLTKEYSLGKGYDPATWVIAYSTTPYQLKVTNALNTYTQNVTVAQLLAGTVTMTVTPGTYNVTFTTTDMAAKTYKFNNVMDIGINMPSTVINGTPVVLTGTFLDALIIIDAPATIVDYYSGSAQHNLFFTSGTFHYAYTSYVSTSLDLYIVAGGACTTKPFTGMVMGNCYWVIGALGVTFNMTLPASMTVTQIPY